MFYGPENTVYISLYVMLLCTVCCAVQLAPFQSYTV